MLTSQPIPLKDTKTSSEVIISIQITDLFIYPLKSARGIAIDKMEIQPTGPKYDRRWMLVDSHNSFITQRVKPQLGQIQTALSKDKLQFSTEGQSTLSIDLDDTGYEKVIVNLFGKPAKAYFLNNFYDQWFSEFLKMKVRLVRAPEEKSRLTSGKYGPVSPVLFQDGYPFLLTSKSTLEELNQKLDTPICIKRFRPNLVIGGAPANQEDEWQNFKINDIPFLSVKACTRCVVIQIDPESGKKNPEVSAVLKSYRTKDGKIVFGSNLIHQGIGFISIGDSLHSIN